MQLAGPGVLGPPADPEAARTRAAARDRTRCRSHRHRAVLRAGRRERAHPRRAIPVPGGPEVGVEGRCRSRRAMGECWRRSTRVSCGPGWRTTSGPSRSRRWHCAPPPMGAEIPMAEHSASSRPSGMRARSKSIGLSNATVDEIAAALEIVELGEVQNAYNITRRDDEDGLRFCADRGIAYVPFFPIRNTAHPAISSGRGKARGDTGPDRARVAAAPGRARAAHPGHLVTDAPRGEHGRRSDRARRRGPGRARGRSRLKAVRELHAGLHVELAERLAQVVLDRARADEQLSGDLAVGVPLRREA